MCGIIGYIGNKEAYPLLMEGLKKLEYRGYDSAGLAVVNKNGLSIAKSKGKIRKLELLLSRRPVAGSLGLGHTRWATHGCPCRANAHPHTDCHKTIAVVHNGIIENYSQLKEELKKKGCAFKSQTDTEVIAHLVGFFYKGDLLQAVRKTLRLLKGSYALGVVSADEPGTIIAARCGSPLVIGLGNKENFIASDTSAIMRYTKKVIYLKDEQIAVITANSVKVLDKKAKAVTKKIDNIKYAARETQKTGFPHFMLKEIYQQPEVFSRILKNYLKPGPRIDFGNPDFENIFKSVRRVIVLGCGTAYHAGLIGKYAIEALARVPVEVDIGSEFRYREPLLSSGTLVVAISQSGETADTLAAVREAKKSGLKVISICNVLGSSLVRESDAVIYTHAGPEVSVASTKAYTAQITVLYLLGFYLSALKKALSHEVFKEYLDVFKGIGAKQLKIIKRSGYIKGIAKKHLHFGAFLYLGRNINFPTALEGALKLKEISYIPAEGYASGEMKHGPIALIDEYRAVVCIANDSFIFDKMVSNIQEILARKGKIIVVATENNKEIKKYAQEVIYIPEIKNIFSPLLAIIPLQILAYYMAVLKGYDVDKPRNLAKSVTVE
ncbi:MAG: glutamine--fructose-6-phosphate transaminase (isomerizing) [Candidatus Omnitrophica bacterium]|nr:glutamine--fructose-6-phosphate transaminase (isomerizing) [Candidatus Omnitrophota bacterium]